MPPLVRLAENPPKAVTNVGPGQEQKNRYSYAYLSGENRPVTTVIVDVEEESEIGWAEEKKTLDEGWYSVDNINTYAGPDKYENFEEVIEHYIEHAIIPRKGPDYKEIPLTEGKVPLALIRKVRRERREQKVNDLLQLGWCILALDFDGDESYGKVLTRTTVYVLGHTDEDVEGD